MLIIKDDSQMGQDDYLRDIVEVNSKANDDIQRKRREDAKAPDILFMDLAQKDVAISVTDGAVSQPDCCIQKDIVAQSDESIETEKFSCSINYAKRHKLKVTFIVLVVIGAGMLLAAYLLGAFDAASLLCGKEDPRHKWSDRYDIWPQVYSQNGPGISSWEYKVNCGSDNCFLSDLTAVNVTTPANEVISLDRDFYTNTFSGEVTRRWVKYGPSDGDFPWAGDYLFEYFKANKLELETRLPFCGVPLPLPQDVSWTRSGSDLHVQWAEPPSSVGFIKVLVFDQVSVDSNVISVVYSKDSSGTVVVDAPLINGDSYSASVSFFWDDGYSYTWETIVW